MEAYCDGSISPATMQGLQSSQLSGQFVGRIAVLIPSIDYGMIEQVKEGVLNAKGNPASTQMEILAVKKAKEICESKGMCSYVILTDSQGAAEQSEVPEVRWLEPGRLHFASLFLERIMGRARYLRQSSRKVINRAKPNRLQAELFEMFSAERTEFQLSKSLLWAKIQMEMGVSDAGRSAEAI